MLLNPKDHPFDFRHPPRLVLGLSLLLALIFGLWHGKDQDLQDRLDQTYVSKLMPVEWPLYDTYLLKRQQGPLLKSLSDDYARKSYTPIARQMGGDTGFVTELQSSGKDYMGADVFTRWQADRLEYDTDHSKLSAFALGLNPQQFRPITFITYQLVPQHLPTLAFNLVLLLIAGCALELALGGGPVLASYIVSGIVGGMGYLLMSGGNALPLATISIGTAGVLGTFTMQFKRERLQLLGSATLLSPWAIVGLWAIKEGIEILVDDVSPLSLIPHMIGFGAGAAVWVAYDRWFRPGETQEIVVSEPEVDLGEIYREQLDQAMQAISRMEFPDARKRLRELVKGYPQDLRALEQLYQIEKLEPASDTFEAVARRLFTVSNTDAAAQVCLSIYRDYARTTQTQRALDSDTCLKLIMRFARLGEVKDADKLMKVVMEKQGHKNVLMPKAAFALSQAYDRLQDPSRAAFYKEMATGATAV